MLRLFNIGLLMNKQNALINTFTYNNRKSLMNQASDLIRKQIQS